jgi:hypothetical protein
VAMIALRSAAGATLSHPTGNCILAQVTPTAGASPPEAWCQARIMNAARAVDLGAPVAGSRPVLIQRDAQFENLATARRACDLLQAEFAGRGQIAGYIV